jgi:orotate phosphoribosyltransferase
VDGAFQLRRGFELARGEPVIVVEDIVSTGLSIWECIDCVKALGANVVAGACLIDRSGGEVDIGVPLVSLTRYKVPAYPADQLPPELAALPPVKPGSRGLS